MFSTSLTFPQPRAGTPDFQRGLSDISQSHLDLSWNFPPGKDVELIPAACCAIPRASGVPELWPQPTFRVHLSKMQLEALQLWSHLGAG